MQSSSLDFLKHLVEAPSVSGYEEKAAAVFRDYVEPFADRVETDAFGNTYAALNPDAQAQIALIGHIDEIGFVVHHVEDEGFLRFRGVGGHEPLVAVGQRVWVHGKRRIPGVIGRKPIHLTPSDERGKKVELHELWIDIGASSKSEAMELLELGDPVTYQWEFEELVGDRVAARGLDNKAGAWSVAEALRLLRQDGGLQPDVGVVAVASAQEEIGCRGAGPATFKLNPVTGLAIDVTFAIDHPGLEKSRYGDVRIGGGACITRGPNINPVVYRLMLEAGRELGEEPQIEVDPGPTATDASAMQVAGAGVPVGLVNIPLRYMHTPCELLSLGDLEACARLMAGYCRKISVSTDFAPL